MKKSDDRGQTKVRRLTKAELARIYRDIEERVARIRPRPKMPRLFASDGKPVATGLALLFFSQNLGKITTMEDLLAFLRAHGVCKSGAIPQPRHLGMQYGFFFLVNGSYHAIKRRALKPGEYCLYSLSRSHPGYAGDSKVDAFTRRKSLSVSAFAAIRKRFSNRCGVCGSEDRKRNLKNKTLVTKLEMGHCDPKLALTVDNCIPMCQYCNKVYRDKFVFSKRGTVLSYA